MLINLGGNLKLEFDKINKNLKLFLDSLRENKTIFKNLEEKLDFIKDEDIVELDKISRLEEGKLKLKQLEKKKKLRIQKLYQLHI